MPQPEKPIIEKLDLFIDDNLENSAFSTDTICHELGLSRSQLHRILIEQTQLSITLYIRKRRLEKAKTLLSTTKLRISEIADAVGITNPTNFSKYFIKEFNVSPTDFRKQSQEFIEAPFDEISLVFDELALSKNQSFIASKPKSNFLWYALLALIMLIGITLYFFPPSQKENIVQTNNDLNEISENSLAILPFKNLGLPDNSFFCDGVMEQIHGSLSLLENLKVISKTSSMLFRDTKKPIAQIASELHVKYILEGSVLQIDKKIRITVGLTNAKEDRVIWTKTYDGDAKDVFSYMSKVAKEVATELHQKLSNSLTDKLDKIPTKNLVAYNEYLQGNQLLQTRIKEKVEASLVKFSKAIELDPNFADAFTNKAVAYYIMGEDQLMDVESAYKMSEKNALTAIRLDAENGRAYAVLGFIYKTQNKWEQAITTFQIALKFSPNDAQINYWYSLTIRSIGQMDEAIKFSTKAVSLDPLANNIYGGHIIGCAYAGRFDLAEKAIKDGELIFNDSYLFHNAKAFYYIKRKNFETAMSEFRICQKLYSKGVYFETLIAFTQAKLGQTAPAELYLKTLPTIPDNNKYFAIVYAGLGNTNLCLKYLELAAEKNDSPNYLKVSPLFDFLYDDPRFNAILQKLGLLNPAFVTQ